MPNNRYGKIYRVINIETKAGKMAIETKDILSYAPMPDGCIIEMRGRRNVYTRNKYSENLKEDRHQGFYPGKRAFVLPSVQSLLYGS